MKAIVCTKYRSPDVLQLTEVETPTPKDNEVLMKVYAASLKGDWHILRGEPLLRLTTGGLLKPKHKILGDDIAGRVEAVGRNVTQFQPGDEVFGISNFGAFAEYRCVPSARANIRVAQALDRLPLKEISLPDDVAQAWKGKVKGKN
jgi:NADPH:quinone reductase-like Zn-dependent oxidoreductase